MSVLVSEAFKPADRSADTAALCGGCSVCRVERDMSVGRLAACVLSAEMLSKEDSARSCGC